MRPDQLGEYSVPGDVQVNPSSGDIVYVTTTMDLDDDKYRRHLWIHDGTSSRRLTEGDADASPRWSPDGSTLAFIRKGVADDAKP
ncbi:MAG: PD40 domain-containing protein, partial [Acidimicrobiia bacterium]|nr:PD40 domain-containing protein [Acidimicrobiia bacterium]